MATNNCGTPCGCTDAYTVVAPCPPSCPEVFNAQCIVYTGADILCNQEIVISRYDYLDTIITKLVNKICSIEEAPAKYTTTFAALASGGNIILNHNLGTQYITLSIVVNTTPGQAAVHGVNYSYTINNDNSITISAIGTGLNNVDGYKVTIIG